MRWLIACEKSGRVRDALRKRGHDAWSCDIQATDSDPRWHFQCDVRDVLHLDWDGMVAHPVCKRLANSGVRWLHERNLWDDLDKAVEFYLLFRNAPIKYKAIENPVMHKHAIARLGKVKRHIVQPWWFGNEAFKATGFELHNLPPLVATNKLIPPKPGTEGHKRWSAIHRCPPGPERENIRSLTFPGIADAIAEQWGNIPFVG